VIDASERIVQLALFFASTRRFVTAEDCRCAGLGYPDDQDTDTFLRMFERDKDMLRGCGLEIEVRDVEGTEGYRLDAAATYARPLELSGEERAALRTVATAMAEDDGFPFASDLSIAAAKLGETTGGRSTATSALVDEAPREQAALSAKLAHAVAAHKRATFSYINSAGEPREHIVEPYGVFTRDGRWYLAGLDTARDEVRIYAVRRMSALAVNTAAAKTPDFTVPDDFSVDDYRALPFQYGSPSAAFTAELRFSPAEAWRAGRLTTGIGELAPQPDGSVLWSVSARDEQLLASWLVANGPGITPLAPPSLRDTLARGLREAVTHHGA